MGGELLAFHSIIRPPSPSSQTHLKERIYGIEIAHLRKMFLKLFHE